MIPPAALVQHAARTGALPANSRLFDQADAVTQARDRGDRLDIAPLVAERVRVSAAARITVAQQPAGPAAPRCRCSHAFSMLDRLNKTLGQHDDGAAAKAGDAAHPPPGPPAAPPEAPPGVSAPALTPALALAPAPPPVPVASTEARGKT